MNPMMTETEKEALINSVNALFAEYRMVPLTQEEELQGLRLASEMATLDYKPSAFVNKANDMHLQSETDSSNIS